MDASFNEGFNIGLIAMGFFMFFIISLRHFIMKFRARAQEMSRGFAPLPPLTEEIQPKIAMELQKKPKFSIFKKKERAYYDEEGNLIDKNTLVKTISTPIYSVPAYDLRADTTATIKTPLPSPDIPEAKKELPQTPVQVSGIIMAYCHKCKQKRELQKPEVNDTTTSRGIKRIAKGKCGVCDTNMAVMLSRT